ncbi:MAG: FAD-dependent oxidoreductase [Gammaproteobacteria bacterium]|nr:FAD-dependent oxidoreductase [Gammaproteobacteria bacterium]
MSVQFPLLFRPGRIGRLEIPNRIVKAPTSSGLSNKDGTVSDRLIRHYRGQAAGGVGLLIVEYAFIDEDASKSAHCQLGISTDDHISGLAWLADVIKDHGARAAIQLEHCGRQKFLGTQPIKSASAIPWPSLKQRKGEAAVPKEMTSAEIRQAAGAFGDAARRAKLAGFELVEIHGAHGYLITNFLSPHTNKRTDEYGGSLENRMRFMVEVIDDCRRKIGPDFPLTIRLSGSDYEPDGFQVDETIEVAKVAVRHGVDALHISGGDHHQMIHQVSPMAIERCHNVYAAAAIKPHVNVPVIASGSINMPHLAEQVLAEGKGDFIGLGRPLWADPEWPRKAREGREEDIIPCIRCNDGCLDRTFFNFRGVSCSVNPNLGREGEFAITQAARRKKIAVIGGGVAGLEAARVLTLRGHDVTIFEKRKFLGGVGIEGSVADFKSDYRFFVDYQIAQIRKLNVPVVQKTLAAADVTGFDVAVVATGAASTRPDIPGADNPSVVDAVPIFLDDSHVGKRVIVLGGGETAVETALYLEQRGREVTLIHRRSELMNRGVAITDKIAYNEMLARTRIRVVLGQQVIEFGTGWVRTRDEKGSEYRYEADTIALGMGYASLKDDMVEALRAMPDLEVHVIGDRANSAKVYEAVNGALKTSLRI